ncbi:DUF3489 domain-containing protein [Aquibium oceanicum]|jgi:hypothetical protein|uniref:DUF3489 domain-containing protein n=1 Tax=Aquibium oceanicum TaxID=1670800 RepID=A0A1L3SMQ4_9HYPH|nr:DUF3489 domain-containing protein [Aquibium oceanicum]APH70625.1 hypothetical protein BSQ44_03900 [Aquibium oceanicum]
MSRLTDTQTIVLSAAAQRANMLALPLPKNLKGGAAQKVIASLLKQGLLEEIDADTRIGEHVWRETGDGHGVTLAITEHGLAAIGIESEAPAGPAEPERSAPVASKPPREPKAREGSKQAQLIAMLQGADGATVAEIAAAFGWQPHTVRGAIAGALKKKLGLDVTSEKVDGRGRVYKLPAA